MDDFVLMLTATLHLAPNTVLNWNENDQTVIEGKYPQNKMYPSGERTIAGPLFETNRLHQLCQSIRE